MSYFWTKEEEARLEELVSPAVSWHVIGAQLGRTGAAVQVKAASMGLSKPNTSDKSPTWPVIVRACEDKRPRTVHELAQLTSTTRVCIDRLMRKHQMAGQAHVAGWQQNRRGAPTPLWLATPGKDARKPTRTEAERQREYAQRMKEEDPLRYQAILTRKALRRRAKRGIVMHQHPVVQALFGMGGQS